MRTIQLSLVAASFALALGGCATTQTSQAGASTLASNSYCGELTDLQDRVAEVYSANHVRSVSPIYLDDPSSAAPNTRAGTARRATYLAGADLVVPAERGVSPAYMERVLTCHAAASKGHASDPLAAEGVKRISVRERGTTFEIGVTGDNAQVGEAIWQRAKALKSGSQVEVIQLSQAPSGAQL